MATGIDGKSKQNTRFICSQNLTRHGYWLKDMVEQFDAKPAEVRALFNNQLDPACTAELCDRMLAVGLRI